MAPLCTQEPVQPAPGTAEDTSKAPLCTQEPVRLDPQTDQHADDAGNPDTLMAAEPTGTPEPADPHDPRSENPDPTACLLVDARNGFNELGRKAGLWTVCHKWANGARFAFNSYRHAAQLIFRRKGDSCYVLLSKEGVTQGDPISMVIYGLALIPLAESLRKAVPSVVQPWYADNATMAGPVSGIAKAMGIIREEGPARGYFPEPSKSILICNPEVSETAKAALEGFNFQYRDGSRYLGSFIGTAATQQDWIDPQIQKWVGGVEALARVAKRFPQTAYAGLAKSLQSEWQYLQRVVPNAGLSFAPVEAALTTTFLPSLLQETPTANTVQA